MTTDLEKRFFDTFGIEKSQCCKYAQWGYEGEEGIYYFCNKREVECWTYPSSNTSCQDKETDYPEITDRILLELICNFNSLCCRGKEIICCSISGLKDAVLRCYINYKPWIPEHNQEKLRQRVQALFEEV